MIEGLSCYHYEDGENISSVVRSYKPEKLVGHTKWMFQKVEAIVGYVGGPYAL